MFSFGTVFSVFFKIVNLFSNHCYKKGSQIFDFLFIITNATYYLAPGLSFTGFGALLLMVCATVIVQYLPASNEWAFQKDFDNILGKVPRIVLASITAYFLGEFTNSFTLAKLKIFSSGKRMSIRFVASSIVGQFVDTTVFVLIAFTGLLPFPVLVSVVLSGWVVKVAWEIIALPITLPIVKRLNKIENEDYYDKGTDFNPFKLN